MSWTSDDEIKPQTARSSEITERKRAAVSRSLNCFHGANSSCGGVGFSPTKNGPKELTLLNLEAEKALVKVSRVDNTFSAIVRSKGGTSIDGAWELSVSNLTLPELNALFLGPIIVELGEVLSPGMINVIKEFIKDLIL